LGEKLGENEIKIIELMKENWPCQRRILGGNKKMTPNAKKSGPIVANYFLIIESNRSQL